MSSKSTGVLKTNFTGMYLVRTLYKVPLQCIAYKEWMDPWVSY